MMKQLAAILACALIACGGGDGPDETSSLITAAEGGTLKLEGSETQLTFPAGALREDTEVTLTMGALSDYPQHEGALSNVLVLAPAILLEQPASLSIDLSDAELGDRLHIVQFTDGVWVRPEASFLELGSGNIAGASIFMLAPTAVVVEASATNTGSIEGQVLHLYTEEPLAGIDFSLRVNGATTATTTSDSDGNFVFANVPVGAVTVEAQIEATENCFNDPTSKEVTVTDDGVESVFFGFVPGPC